jgi:GH15 family glucan-1,4-alpha-glucosidase
MAADASGSPQPCSDLADRAGYLPVSEHGLIGDLHTVALVGTNGTIDWHCSPSFDAPSFFGSLLDADAGGCFELAAALPAKTRQFYLPDTNVLITRFLAPDGVGEIQDFMPIADVAEPQRHRLIRRVVCVRGAMPFRARIAPRFGYGTDPHTLTETAAGLVFTSDSLTVGLSATVPVGHDGHDVTAHFTLAEGESAVFALDEVTGGGVPRGCSGGEAQDLGEATIAFWRTWLAASRYRGRWRETVHRSALTLKLLTYAPTGAIVAAPTTSLPEQIGGERNWDYRYVWVRDAAFCVYALLRLGFSSEADAFMTFILRQAAQRDAIASGPMPVMSGIDGRTDLPEVELSHLAGYRGSRPVRVGNAAASQLQLDMASSWTRSICTTSGTSPSPAPTGRRSRPGPIGSATTGTSPMRASGRPGAAPGSSYTRSSCAGWPWSGRSGWRTAGGYPPSWTAGGMSAMRSTGGSWIAAGHQTSMRSPNMRAQRSWTLRF